MPSYKSLLKDPAETEELQSRAEGKIGSKRLMRLICRSYNKEFPPPRVPLALFYLLFIRICAIFIFMPTAMGSDKRWTADEKPRIRWSSSRRWNPAGVDGDEQRQRKFMVVA